MAVSGNYYAGGTGTTNYGAKLANEVWQANIEAAVYEKGALFPLIAEKDRLYNRLHVRKIDRFSTNTLTFGGSQDGQGLTYSTATDSDITLTPIGTYVAVALSMNQIKQMNVDATQEFKDSVNDALSQQIDIYTFQQTVASSSLVTNVYGDSTTSVDRASFLNLLYTIRRNARVAVQPGNSDIKFILHPNQGPAFMSIPEITAANLRGDTESPNVRGIVYKALGCEVIVSGNVQADTGSAYVNPIFVKSAMAISWNERPNVMEQQFELQKRIIAYSNYGVGLIWEDRVGGLKTKQTM